MCVFFANNTLYKEKVNTPFKRKKLIFYENKTIKKTICHLLLNIIKTIYFPILVFENTKFLTSFLI